MNGPIVSRVVLADEDGTGTVEVEMDPARQAFLRDHQVGGSSLLSTVMGIEAMARGACLLNPGHVVSEVREVMIYEPYRIHGAEPGNIRVEVGKGRDSALRSVSVSSDLVGGKPDVHFASTVELAVELPVPTEPPEPQAIRPLPPTVPCVEASTIYSLYFHGPSFRVLHHAHASGSGMVGRLRAGLPAISDPQGPTASAPLLVELGLQTAGLLELVRSARMMIPRSIERVVRFRSTESYDGIPLRAEVAPSPGTGPDTAYDATIVGDDGAVHLSIFGYRTTELATPPGADVIESVVSAFS